MSTIAFIEGLTSPLHILVLMVVFAGMAGIVIAIYWIVKASTQAPPPPPPAPNPGALADPEMERRRQKLELDRMELEIQERRKKLEQQ